LFAFTVAGAALAALPAAAGHAQSEGTVGDCISDGLYGNEPNIEDPFAPGGPEEQDPGTLAGGRVAPTQSPGPFVNNPLDPDNPHEGSSVGDFHQIFGGGAVPAFCRAGGEF
jgi:hypothetical protein